MEGSLLVGCYISQTSASKRAMQIRKRQSNQPDLGLRETICKLAERPWPRGREVVEPALLVAWLSTEATEPMETMETDLL